MGVNIMQKFSIVNTNYTVRIFIVASVVILSYLLISTPWLYMLDDTFFYFQISNNIAQGNGSTFNNIIYTNGYHPLWMLFCTISSVLSFGNNLIALQIGAAIQIIMLFGIFNFSGKICKLLDLKATSLSFVIIVLCFLSWGLIGSEAFINGLMIVYSIYFVIRYRDSDKLKDWFILGLLLGLMFLARLDNILAIIVLGFYLLNYKYKSDKSKSLIYISIMLLGFMITVIPYLYSNYHYFGHLVPISGSIKSVFPHIDFRLEKIGSTGLLLVLISIISIAWEILFDKNKSRKQLIVLLNIMAIVNPIYICFFADGNSSWHWYFVWNYLMTALFISQLIDKYSHSKFINFSSQILTIALCLYSVPLLNAQIQEPNTPKLEPLKIKLSAEERWEMRLSAYFKTKLEPNARIAVCDFPGMIAYFTDMHIFPTDGLVGDFASQDSISKFGMKAYLKANKINYFFGPYYDRSRYKLGYWNREVGRDSLEFRFLSVLHRNDVDTILFTEKDLVLRTLNNVKSKTGLNWAVWRIR